MQHKLLAGLAIGATLVFGTAQSASAQSLPKVHSHTYKTAQTRITWQQANGYDQVKLGYGIVGYSDAGAGTSSITFNEGRWTISVLSSNPDNYDYPSASLQGQPTKLAKQVVAYLHTHRLPAPHKYGRIMLYADSRASMLEWQQYKKVYYIKGAHNPLAAVKAAVAHKK